MVGDLGEVQVPTETDRRIRDLPSARSSPEVSERLARSRPVVFLDYDGTLTPIVEDPAAALLPPGTRRAIERLVTRCPVAVVSGRDLAEVRELVCVTGVVYAGSHGFDILAGDGTSHRRGDEFMPALDRAEEELEAALGNTPGVRVERKRLAIAIHFRRADDRAVPEVERVVAEVAARHPELRAAGGKKVFELRPAFPWDKGAALLWLLETLGLDREDVLPVYVGDDETDEDAFRALRDRGLGIVVRGEDDERPTAARYSLADPEDVRLFLEELARLQPARRP